MTVSRCSGAGNPISPPCARSTRTLRSKASPSRARLAARVRINAALEYVLKQPDASIDRRRVAIMGYSFGGIVTTLAASRSDRYAAFVVQAPGALNWNRSAELRPALTEAAARVRVPAWCAVAENDATTESARQICGVIAKTGASTTLKIYPPFTGGGERPGNPPGHALFGPRGVDVWRQDLLTFLATVLR